MTSILFPREQRWRGGGKRQKASSSFPPLLRRTMPVSLRAPPPPPPPRRPSVTALSVQAAKGERSLSSSSLGRQDCREAPPPASSPPPLLPQSHPDRGHSLCQRAVSFRAATQPEGSGTEGLMWGHAAQSASKTNTHTHTDLVTQAKKTFFFKKHGELRHKQVCAYGNCFF